PGHPSGVHFSSFVYNGMCRVHFARGQWQALGEAARLGVEASEQSNNQVEVAIAHLWQALRAGHDGGAAHGPALRQHGTAVMDALGVPPPDGYFEALCACLEQDGRLEEALAVRQRELALVRGQGRMISEVYCQRERCRLLAASGRLTSADLEEARAAARQL